MAPEKKERKRDSLNPLNWIRRSESSSRHRPSTSLISSQSVGSHSTPPLQPSESQPQQLSLRPSSSSLASKSAETLEPPTAKPSDLWSRAFGEANDETQKWIQKHGLDSADLMQSKDQIKELIGLVESNTLSEQNDKPLKVEIGNQKIIVREYIADAVGFITMVGDAAIAFTPPQASAPWAVAKAVLQIPVKQIEQKAALLGTVQWFTRIVRRGQIYEDLYKVGTTDDRAVRILHDALFDVYKAALELLATSDTLFDSGVARQTLAAILRPSSASGKVNDLFRKEQQLIIEVQACDGSRSSMSSNAANDGIKELKKQLDQLSSPLPRIDKSVANLLKKIDERKLEELIEFISPEMFGKGHAAVTEARIENTGDWLLASRDFRAWQEITSSSAVLCLKGTVGTGKTYLTSKVVDYVKQTLNTSQHDEGFAFFYCNRSGPSMQDPIVVLRSFVRQLSGRAFDEPDLIQSSLVQKCQIAKREGRELGYKDCKDLILESLDLYSKTTIILDALDESDITTYNLCTILIELMEKSKKPIKIFISTRPDRDYLKALEDQCIITLDDSGQQKDIERFLTEKLYSTKGFKERSQASQDEIKHVFETRSCGMFRWVYLQVRSLEKHITDDAVHNWARKLPLNLTEAYDQLWEKMREYDESDVALAERAIMWVLCSFWPLRSETLLEAIQYVNQGSAVVRKEKRTEHQILSLCQDLLTIDEENEVWMLPHASVAEYFEAKGWMSWKCDVFASKVCLGFLENFQSEDEEPGYGTFAHYVRYYWYRHVGRYDEWLGSMKERRVDPDLTEALKRFLGSPSESSASYRNLVRYNRELRPDNMALFAACRYGFYYSLPDWWLEGKITEEMALQQNANGYNSLALAVLGNCMPMCRQLVDLMDAMHPDTKRHWMALRTAVFHGSHDVLELLVKQGTADVHFPGGESGETVAQFAAREKPKMLQWMLDQGFVDLERENSSGYWNGNLFIAAAGWGDVESIQILLEAGANVNAAVQNGIYGSALAVTISHRQVDVHRVRLLLDGGADPNLPLRVGEYGGALEASVVRMIEPAEDKREEQDLSKIQHMLLEAGADPTAVFERGKHGSALAAAAFYGRKDILEAMINRVGAERAMEALRQSRHPKEREFEDEEEVQRWKATVAYLAEEVGVGKEALHNIGMWGVEPEPGEDRWGREIFVLKYS